MKRQLNSFPCICGHELLVHFSYPQDGCNECVLQSSLHERKKLSPNYHHKFRVDNLAYLEWKYEDNLKQNIASDI